MPTSMGPNSYYPSSLPLHEDSEASDGNIEGVEIRSEGQLPRNQPCQLSYATAYGGQEYWNHSQWGQQGHIFSPYPSTNTPGLRGLGYSIFEPRPMANQIMHTGYGIVVAGHNTEDFANRTRLSLCYQCCKRIPLQTLLETRKESCDKTSCRRTQEARLRFISMPRYAAEACEDFRIFLHWWMEKVDLEANKTIEERARERVLEMRDDIP
ncbi:hypothetical protein F4823DRAFT_423523 [Ustulina deusta]|nr:hypothetical protein F4823DRAFT_423523 [Ustulina deusta]